MANVHHGAGGQNHAGLSWSWHFFTQALARDLAVSRPETACMAFPHPARWVSCTDRLRH